MRGRAVQERQPVRKGYRKSLTLICNTLNPAILEKQPAGLSGALFEKAITTNCLDREPVQNFTVYKCFKFTLRSRALLGTNTRTSRTHPFTPPYSPSPRVLPN